MAVTLEQVRSLLESDEPKYSAAAKMGAALLPHLQSIVTSPDEDTASKAAYLASLINDPRAAQVMQAAARHRSPLVRLAVAAAARTTRVPNAAAVIASLTRDRDTGVRKAASKSARAGGGAAGSAVASVVRAPGRAPVGARPRPGAPPRPRGRTAELEYEGAPASMRTYYLDALWFPPGGSAWQTLEQVGPFDGTKDRAETFRSTLQLKWQNHARTNGGTLLVRCFVLDQSRTRWLDCRAVY